MKITLINSSNENLKFINGVSSLIICSISFSLMSACVKSLNGRIPVAEIVLSRAIISLLITRYVLRNLNIDPWGNNKRLLLIRGILGTGALFFIFKAIVLLPLASATIIQYTYPTITSLAAWLILKEKINSKIIFAAIIGWIGVTFIAQPSWLVGNNIGLPYEAILIALFGSFLTSMAYICVKKLSNNEHPFVIILYFPLVSVPISLPFVIYQGVIPSIGDCILLIGVGIFTQIGQIGLTNGLKILPASQACSINYLQVVFAALIGFLIFNENINSYVALGGIFIFIATILSISARNKIN